MKDVDWNCLSLSDEVREKVILRVKDVDWNCFYVYHFIISLVILRVKDVDWNISFHSLQRYDTVILRVKDVDWNIQRIWFAAVITRHPSCEGCGLKSVLVAALRFPVLSSFVWRMWIEIIRETKTTKVTGSSFVWRMWIEISPGSAR